jgi:hypothetical protein
MRCWIIAATLISMVASGIPFASAQSDRPAPPLFAPSPNGDCQRGTSVLPAPGETTGSANPSDQLSRSKGVICPPAGIDLGIAAPAVGTGVMPVIPPPGTPGGDPNLVPK